MKKALLLALILSSIALVAWAAEEDVKTPESTQLQVQADQKWSPEYGPKGELLNGQHAVVPFGASVPGDLPEEPPTIQTIVFFEDFEEPVGWLGDNPPQGWSVLDSSDSREVAWDNYDWYRYVGGTGWGSTALARVYGSSSAYYNDDWFISPSVDFSVATTCSLTYRYYYDDYSTVGADSFMIYLSDDGGSTWGYTVNIYAGADSGTLTTPKLASWDISSFAAGKSNLKVAFRYFKPVYSLAGYAGFDNVRLVGNSVEALNETMDGAWGTYGNNPPAGWQITSYFPAYSDVWNNNDWHQYSTTTWGYLARVYYTTPIEQQNEWLITPPMSLAPAGDQALLRFKQYYNDGSTPTDSAIILGSTNGGATWSQVVEVMTGADRGTASAPDYASYDVTSWANGQSNVAFAFKYVGNYSIGNWYIDSLYVETLELASNDVATTGINSPNFVATGYNWDVNVQVYNNGTSPATFVDSTKIFQIPRSTVMFEDFNDPVGWRGDNPPPGWAVLDSGSTPGVWDNADWHQYYNSSSGDTVARVYYASGVTQNEWLISPIVDASALSNVHLTFRTYYNWEGTTDTAYILGTTDNWATTIQIDKWYSDHGSLSSLGRYIYDISSWADGAANLQIAFKYIGLFDLYWYVDDAEIYTPLPAITDYVSSETVTGLASLESRAVQYAATWNDPDAGDYTISSFTNLAGDADRSNDTASVSLIAYEHYESGGPDAGNHVWATNKDGGTGSAFNWIDITAIGAPINFNLGSADDRWTSGIPMGFTFNFYTNPYARIFISENGFASFDTIIASELTNYGIPSTSGQDNLLALLWDDLSGVASGTAYYYTNNVDTFIVSYIDWDFYSTPASRIDMQMILCATDGSVKFQYQTVGPVITLSHTIGIEDDPGNIGLQFEYNFTPRGNLALPGLAVSFLYLPPGYDAAVQGITSPGSLLVLNQPVTPKTVVTNLGGLQANVPVHFEIFDSTHIMIYSATTTINNMLPLATDTAFFTPFTPTIVGNHRCSTYTALPADADPSNDFGTSTFFADRHYGEGGPDAYNYYWIDNTVSDPDAPVYGWIDITTDGTPINTWMGTPNAGWTDPIYMDIPGGFWFYGVAYDSLVIGTGCWTSFLRRTAADETNDNIPSVNSPASGVFIGHDDHIDTTGAICYYKYDAPNNRFIVSWIDWTYYLTTSTGRNPHDVQIIIDADDRTVVMQFGPVTGRYDYDITVGIQDPTQTIASKYYYGSSTTLPGTPKFNVPYDGLAIKHYYSPPAHDMKPTAFLSPDLSGLIGEPITPQVNFLNFGGSAETSVPVRLTIEPGGYNNVQTIPAISPGQTLPVTFTNFTPSVGGLYTLTTIAELGTDVYRANDTLVHFYAVYNSLIDFESGPGAFVPTGDWQWGAPTNPEAPAPTSGANYWGTGLYGDYHAGLSTLEFNLNLGSTAPAISFASWYDTELRFDGGNFGISTDGGASWIVISPTRGYDDTSRFANPIYPDSIFSGHNQGFWEIVTFPLDAFAGASVMARFAFGADISIYYPGWFIDDLGLIDCRVLAPNMVYNPSSLSGMAATGRTDMERITINNTGEAVLRISASTSINPPTMALNSLPQLTNPKADMEMTAPEVDEATKTDDQPPMILDINCPTGSIYGQEPTLSTEAWAFGTSDVDPGPNYLRYENLTGVNAEISELRFWGIDAFHNGTAWSECDEDPAQLRIIFHADNAGMPGDTLAMYDLSLSGIPTGYTFPGTVPFTQKEYIATLSPAVTMYGGWVSIQGTSAGNNCWFMWQNSLTGDGASLFFDGTSIVTSIYNLSMCINGVDLNWLSTNPLYLEVAPGGNGAINAVMDATNLNVGSYTGNVRLATNAPQGVVDIPVTFAVVASGTIFGHVYEQNGTTPIAGAQVETYDSFNALIETNITDSLGEYTLGLTPGTYREHFSKNGYASRDTTGIIVVSGQTNTITIRMAIGGCDYMPGDINNNGAPNGIDIVYGVTYLKGGATPKDTCDCRPTLPLYPFYGAMDVNGNCATNGIDITFFVAYLKGLQPALKWCLDCPPAGVLVAPAVEPRAIKVRNVEIGGGAQ